MCASCGCGKVYDQMGDDRHLTMSDLKSAAEAADISVQEVAKNIQAAAGQKGQESNGAAQAQQGAARTQDTPGAERERQTQGTR